MRKITYHYSALSKQTWFYSGILYLILTSLVYILVAAYRVEGYYESLNLPLILTSNLIGMVFFWLLSLGHLICYSEYDDEKITYKNRLLRTERTFFFKDAEAVIFDKKGVKFYASCQALVNKEKPDFYIPFFRDGKIEALQINAFFKAMKDREKAASEAEEGEINGGLENGASGTVVGPLSFKVYKTFKVLPGYGRKWKYLAFAYACLTLLVLMNCAKPLAVVIGLMQTF